MKRAGNPASSLAISRNLKPCLKNLAGVLEPEQAQAAGRRLLEAMQQEKEVIRLCACCTVAEPMADKLDPGHMRAIGARIVEAMKQDREGSGLIGLGWQLPKFKAWIEPPLLHQAAERLIDAAASEKSRDRLGNHAKALARIVDRLEAADARRAAETAVGIFVKEDERQSRGELLTRVAELAPLDGKSSEPTVQALAESVARALARAASGVEPYVVYEPELLRNVTALLRHASDQALLDILKQPCAGGSFRKVMLQVWEIKYAQQFDNDLRRFVEWAISDPRTQHLDFYSVPRIDTRRKAAAGAISSQPEG